MSFYLNVPIHVDALIVKLGDEPVVQPMADFRRLPYFDGDADVNPGVPYLSEAILSQPFENRNLHLPPGVHLHWSLPDALTRGIGDGDTLSFPRVPNRWLVKRTDEKNVDQVWYIESDALSRTLPPGLAPECATVYPYLQDKQQPYRYIGRRLTFDEWQTEVSIGTRPAGIDYLSADEALTAIGYGEPSFSAFYPNCASVFGMYDQVPDGASPEKWVYAVFGWYSDNDPASEFFTDTVRAPGKIWDNPWWQIASEKFSWLVRTDERIHIEFPKLAFFAQLNMSYQPQDATGSPKLVFGNTPSQALAAFLASQVDASQQRRIQEQLEAILLSPALAQSHADTGAKFTALRHERSFNAASGGTLWTLRADPDSNAVQGETAKTAHGHLSDELAFAVDALNRAQAALDRAGEQMDSLAKELYSDWAKYMLCAYPPDGNAAAYTEPDAAGAFVLRSANSLLQKLADHSLQSTFNASKQAVENLLADLLLVKDEDILDWHKVPGVLVNLQAVKQVNPQMLTQLQSDLLDWFLKNAAVDPAHLSTEDAFSATEKELILGGFNAAITHNEGVPLEERYANRTALEAQFPDSIRHLVPYKLQAVPAPRYWVPNEPVALIAGDVVRHSDPFDLHHRIPCFFTVTSADTPRPADFLQAMTYAVQGAWKAPDTDWQYDTHPEKFDSYQRGVLVQLRQPWHPFLLEWIVAMHSAPGGVVTQNGGCAYDPNFVLNNYTLPENAVELQLVPAVKSFEPTERTFRGRSILTRHAENNLERRLAAYLAENLPADLTTDFPSTPGDLDKYLKNQIKPLQQKYEALPGGYDAGGPVYAALRAFAQLAATPSLSQSLEGFNQALLMHKQTLQLVPDDPIGFDAVSAITRAVRTAVPQGVSTAPQPLNDFNPIRCGSVELEQFRLVDTFGQVVDLNVNTALSGESMPGLTHGPSGIIVPPRLVQPARLNFRWLSARLTQADGATALEMSTHPATSPICGWVVPNPTDHSVGVHDAEGRSLGVIRKVGENVRWDIAPGEFFLPIDEIPNPHLADVVRDLFDRSQSTPKFFDDWLLCVQDALENIEPEGQKHHDAFSLMVAHPLAVVRASLDLQLQGLPANNQNWDVFASELNAFDPQASEDIARQTCNFTKVKFPIRLGEYRRLDDGLVGFWQETAPAQPGQPSSIQRGFYVNDSAAATIANTSLLNPNNSTDKKILAILQDKTGRVHKHAFLSAFPNGQGPDGHDIWDGLTQHAVITPVDLGPASSDIIYYADAPDLMQSIDAPSIILTMLFDPRGVVHATCGIQPVKSIQIPAGMYAEALRGIEMTYLSTLLLTRPGRIELPLPEEQGYRWSWLELEDGNWKETRPGESPPLTADFGPLEIREGWLKLNQTE